MAWLGVIVGGNDDEGAATAGLTASAQHEAGRARNPGISDNAGILFWRKQAKKSTARRKGMG